MAFWFEKAIKDIEGAPVTGYEVAMDRAKEDRPYLHLSNRTGYVAYSGVSPYGSVFKRNKDGDVVGIDSHEILRRMRVAHLLRELVVDKKNGDWFRGLLDSVGETALREMKDEHDLWRFRSFWLLARGILEEAVMCACDQGAIYSKFIDNVQKMNLPQTNDQE